jgi:hypothetical protein
LSLEPGRRQIAISGLPLTADVERSVGVGRCGPTTDNRAAARYFVAVYL